MQLFVESRGKIKGAYFPLEINMPEDATLGMLKNGIAHLVPALPIVRQRLTDAQKRPLVGDEKRLTDLGIENNARLSVKDLGPQISWRTVFLVEYAGPLLIHPIIYYLAPLVWSYFGFQYDKSLVQKLVLVLVVLRL